MPNWYARNVHANSSIYRYSPGESRSSANKIAEFRGTDVLGVYVKKHTAAYDYQIAEIRPDSNTAYIKDDNGRFEKKILQLQGGTAYSFSSYSGSYDNGYVYCHDDDESYLRYRGIHYVFRPGKGRLGLGGHSVAIAEVSPVGDSEWDTGAVGALLYLGYLKAP